MSSANNLTLTLTCSGRSLMYARNSMGPRTDPCGTPDDIGMSFDLFFSITKTCLYNFYPLKPHFYIVKLGFTGVYIIFLISAQKHRLWVLVRTASARRF